MSIRTMVFIGAPSSGKTYLARMITSRLQAIGATVDFVPEVVRDDIVRHGQPEHLWDQMRWLHMTDDLERSTLERSKADYIVSDGGVLTNLFFCLTWNRYNPQRREWLLISDIASKFFEAAMTRYDHVFVCPLLLGKQNDGVRFQTDEQLLAIDQCTRTIFSATFLARKATILPEDYSKREDVVLTVLKISSK